MNTRGGVDESFTSVIVKDRRDRILDSQYKLRKLKERSSCPLRYRMIKKRVFLRTEVEKKKRKGFNQKI